MWHLSSYKSNIGWLVDLIQRVARITVRSFQEKVPLMSLVSQLLAAQIAEVSLVKAEHGRTREKVAALLELAKRVTLRADDEVLWLADWVVLRPFLLQMSRILLAGHPRMNIAVALWTVILIAG
jgi:hypothetical protein